MNEVTVFALALLAVPVLARFARVESGLRRIYQLIGLGGLFLIAGEGTKLMASKVAVLGMTVPIVDPLMAVLAFLSISIGTLFIALNFVRHWKEIHIG